MEKTYFDIEDEFVKNKNIKDIEVVVAMSRKDKREFQDEGYDLVAVRRVDDYVKYTLIKIKEGKITSLNKDYEKLKIELNATNENYIKERMDNKKLKKSINGYKGQNAKLHNRINKLVNKK
jgi:major membrane immunogen (membrane-anchored lipoprotein)